MKKLWLAVATSAVLVAGCSASPKEPEVPEIVEVEILTSKEVPLAPLTLEARVTQGQNNIEDAHVQFEFWQSGMRDDAYMLDGEYQGDGVYQIQVEPEHDGIYYMFAHTTASGMHVMPKQEIKVGEPNMAEVIVEDPNENNDMR